MVGKRQTTVSGDREGSGQTSGRRDADPRQLAPLGEDPSNVKVSERALPQ